MRLAGGRSRGPRIEAGGGDGVCAVVTTWRYQSGVGVADRLLVDAGADGRVSVSTWLDDELPSEVGLPVELASPLTADESEELRWYLEDYLRAPFGVYEQRGPRIADRLQEWGRRMFAAVFADDAAREAYVCCGPAPSPVMVWGRGRRS